MCLAQALLCKTPCRRSPNARSVTACLWRTVVLFRPGLLLTFLLLFLLQTFLLFRLFLLQLLRLLLMMMLLHLLFFSLIRLLLREFRVLLLLLLLDALPFPVACQRRYFAP